MPDTMKAARMHIDGDVRELRIDEIAIPEPGPGEVLVKVKAAGVCLSDVHLLDGSLTPPHLEGNVVTLGHETAGVVAALGEGVTSFKEGDRVVLRSGYRSADGKTYGYGIDFDGGWAEYIVAKASVAIELPDSVPFDVAAIVPDAISTPWSAIEYTAQVSAGTAVGVWGVGGLGAHAIKLLISKGAKPILAIDPSEAARKRAEEYGVDLAIDSSVENFVEIVSEATGGNFLDFAFDFAGVPPVRKQALEVLGTGGALVLAGISGKEVVIPNDLEFQMKKQSVLGHYGSQPGSVSDIIEMLKNGVVNFDDSVTETLPLTEAQTAVEHLEKKVGNPIRIVLHPED